MFTEMLRELDSAEYQQLRPAQEEVLNSYQALLREDGREIAYSDVAIEMPAGTGKTLVALLIAEKHRRMGRSVAFLTGTRQLGAQVFEDAVDLGMSVVRFQGRGSQWSRRDLGAYRRHESLAIMNYWAYFNIRPTPPPADVLIMDDAHLAENALRELFSVRVDRRLRNELYTRILALLVASHPARYQSLSDVIHDRVPSREPLLVPFSDILQVQRVVVDLLDEAARTTDSDGNNDSIYYNWPRIRQNIDALAVYITLREITLRPVICPSLDNSHFATPQHRLYLSATLGDAEDFQRRIGCNGLYVIRPSDAQPGERGRRMLVMFPTSEEGPDLLETQTEGLRQLWPVARKRLWMCSSWDEVEEFKTRVPTMRGGSPPPIWELRGPDEAQLDEFRQARLGHLFTAGRYDGMDFPGDQCRLVIIPSPPVTMDAQEEFFSSHLKDASFMKSRFSQRVAQALGRCNRGSADFAVYVLLDARFERLFGGSDPEYLAYIPRDIVPEVESVLEDIEEGFVESCERARRFLSGDFDESDRRIAAFRQTTQTESPAPAIRTAQDEVQGWLALWRGDAVSAADHFQRWEQKLRSERQSGSLGFAGYCLAWSRYLCYLRQTEQEALPDAISAFERASQSGPSSWFTTTLRSVLNTLRQNSTRQARAADARIPVYTEAVLQAWDDILWERGLRIPALNRWLDKCVQNLDSEHHDEVTEAIWILGRLLGFDSQRPQGTGMPDVVWRYDRGPSCIVTWEVKAEVAGGERPVTLEDVNQANGQGRWAQTNYGSSGFTCICLLAGRVRDFERGVYDRLGNLRCIEGRSLVTLANTVRALFDVFRNHWTTGTSEARMQARASVSGRIPDATWLHDACEMSEGFISGESLVRTWSQVH